MDYVTSDLHGCMDKYRELLEKIRFGPEDTLYFLGDALDRGPAGFQILLDMAARPNVKAILGSHEDMAIQALPLWLRYLQKGRHAVDDEDWKAMDRCLYNGAMPAIQDFLSLDRRGRLKVWNYMKGLPLYREVSVEDRQFVLVHGGLGNFSPSRPLAAYQRNELVWSRPEPDTVFYSDKLVILGHTPTLFLYEDSGGEFPEEASFFRTQSFIDIDCGCVFEDGRLGCLCLDTMEEVYV